MYACCLQEITVNECKTPLSYHLSQFCSLENLLMAIKADYSWSNGISIHNIELRMSVSLIWTRIKQVALFDLFIVERYYSR